MSDLAPVADGVHRIAIFNPGSNTSQVSRLRLLNTGGQAARVTIEGTDDRGMSPDTGNNCSGAVEVDVSGGGGGGAGGTRYGVGDTVTNMPSGSWFPSLIGGGSFTLSGGSWTLTLNDGAYALYRGYRWTCRSSTGCRVEDRVVRAGMIVETTE